MKNDLFYLSWYTVRTKSTRGREVGRFGQSILDEAALYNILLASHGSEKSASKALAGISHADVDRLLGSVAVKVSLKELIHLSVADPAPSLAFTTSSPPN